MTDQSRRTIIRWAVAATLCVVLTILAARSNWFEESRYYAQITGYRISIILSSGAAGFALGWFLSPQASGLRLGLMLTGLVYVFWQGVFEMGPLGSIYTLAAAAFSFAIGIGYWLRGRARAFFKPPNTFGSAQWATPEHLEANGAIGTSGLRLGYMPSDEGLKPIHYTGDRHLLTVAPTRSGKGTTLIVPNLLTYEGSLPTIDPKGENASITAQARRAMGQTVHIVDPWGIVDMPDHVPARFNPLDWLDPTDIDMAENAMLLADALIVSSDKGEPFWTEEAKGLLQGIILYVATDPYERQERHLGRVRDLLLMPETELKKLFACMAASAFQVVASTGLRCQQKDEKLLSNVLASAQAQTHFLDSPRMRESLSASDFRFEDLKTSEMSIYLVLPSDRLNTFGRWLRLMIQQAITVNARNITVRPELPVLFLLDEMPALGRLAMVEQAYGLMAGFGLQLWGIAQDLSQLKRIYGDAYEGFIANSGVVSYFGSRDRMTAEYMSALAGQTTVWNLSSAVVRSVGSTGNQSNRSESTTDTTAATHRKLAFPDELMRIAPDRGLLFIGNLDPILMVRQPWYEHPSYSRTGRNLHAPVVQPVAQASVQSATVRPRPLIPQT